MGKQHVVAMGIDTVHALAVVNNEFPGNFDDKPKAVDAFKKKLEAYFKALKTFCKNIIRFSRNTAPGMFGPR